MKKFLIGVVIIAVALIVTFLISQQSTISTIAFDMKYHALSGAKDELRHNSFWGFGGNEEDTPFITEVKKDTKNLEVVYNPYLKGAEQAAVEYEDQKVLAFYFDLNADGKLSDNEKILPIDTEDTGNTNSTEFVTPDFISNTDDGRQVPFRVLLQANFYGDSSSPNCMWSPSCVLEGISTINEEPVKLILFASRFPGSFKEFGRTSYSLVGSEEKIGRYLSKNALSSIISYKGQFYTLKLNGSHEQGKSIRASLRKYTGTTGELAVKMVGDTNLKVGLSSARIIGSKDTTVQFYISEDQFKLPKGVYKFNRGYINYSVPSDEWQVSFTEGDEFNINANRICKLEFGKPELIVSAVDESKRYNDPEEQRVYSKGTSIYISRKIKGKAGEVYGRFSQKLKDTRRQTNIEPEIRIVDAQGKEIVAATKIKYG